VVGVAVGPDRQGHDLPHLAGRLELPALGDQLVEGPGSGRGQVGVAEQDHVLDGVRDPVDLAVVGDALDGQLVERVPGVVGELERVDGAVLDQVADPVVGVKTRSGTLPAWAAVTYTVWRSLDTAWTLI
jgi:hypothetical protein